MVISQKIIEKEMGNRGSKSTTYLKNVTVKEQRVYGSWHIVCLRCTLMGFERNYQVKILSNQIKRRYYISINKAWDSSSLNGGTNSMPNSCESKAHIKPNMNPILLNAYFITGWGTPYRC